MGAPCAGGKSITNSQRCLKWKTGFKRNYKETAEAAVFFSIIPSQIIKILANFIHYYLS